MALYSPINFCSIICPMFWSIWSRLPISSATVLRFSDSNCLRSSASTLGFLLVCLVVLRLRDCVLETDVLVLAVDLQLYKDITVVIDD